LGLNIYPSLLTTGKEQETVSGTVSCSVSSEEVQGAFLSADIKSLFFLE
jgi:hypothetical protein